MTADFPVVLDACVLVPASLRDTLLRCAERRMYLPRWSNEILDELRRTLLEKLGRSPEQVDHLLNELNRHFADVRVEGFETLVALMTNDPGDRHIIAAAVKCGAEAIVTFNLRHFPDAALDTWNIEVQHPDEFLVHLYHLNPDLIVNILHEQAAFIASRTKVAEGDTVYLRVFGDSYIGKCRIAGPWKPDPDGPKKYEGKTGFFPIDELIRWKRSLPRSLIIRDLSTSDVRHRIVPIESADGIKIETAQGVYERLGFGGADGQIVVLEKGIEEAIKPNLASLGLKLADDSIQQQFAMGPGVGRSDLICTDHSGALVVIELKRGMASDEAIGQVLRYIGYVRENIASPNQKVHGWIVAGDYDEHLRLSASAANIKILVVRLG